LVFWACQLARADGATGQLVIMSTPPGATVSIDGTRAGRAPLTKPHLLPGEHMVSAHWPDDREASVITKVVAGQSTVVQLEAKATTGQLVIMSNPTGATLSIDGKHLNKTAPTTLRDLPAGPHVLRAEWPDGRATDANAVVEAGSSSVLQLVAPAFGQLMVMSDPPGAQVSVDGKPQGTAPLTVKNLRAGNHAVTGEWPDGRTGSGTGIAQSNQVAIVRLKAGPMPTGQLIVVTTPPGASIFIDEHMQSGVTPLSIREVTAGAHKVTARWPSGRTANADATIKANASTALKLEEPPPPTGVVSVASEPPGAKVTIDGKPQAGATPTTVKDLVVGSHTALLEWPDGRNRSVTFNVIAGMPATMNVRAPAPTVGQIVVTTEPAGAQISVDGKRQATPAPLTVRDLGPGPHEVQAEWPSGRSAKSSATVQVGASASLKLSEPPPPVGQLVIAATPVGAQISVDGKRQPTPAPMTMRDLPPGPHEVLAQWPDGRIARTTATVIANGSAAVQLEAPPPAGAELTLDTEPPGADLTVDGTRVRGPTPATVRGLAAGTHTVVASWPDGRISRSSAFVTAGGSLTLKLRAPAPPTAAAPPPSTLPPPPPSTPPAPPPPSVPSPPSAAARARLSISSDPPGAQAILNGRAQPGTTPLTIKDVGEGGHSLVVRWPDGREVIRTVMVGESGEVTIKVTAPQ
jgi:hypothetical protein